LKGDTNLASLDAKVASQCGMVMGFVWFWLLSLKLFLYIFIYKKGDTEIPSELPSIISPQENDKEISPDSCYPISSIRYMNSYTTISIEEVYEKFKSIKWQLLVTMTMFVFFCT
jgi:hypothetical protein